MAKLDSDFVRSELESTAWTQEGETIILDQQFSDFEEAIQYVNRVAGLAEVANHHPDILVHEWNKVRVTCWTHSEGGVTDADLKLARQIDELA